MKINDFFYFFYMANRDRKTFTGNLFLKFVVLFYNTFFQLNSFFAHRKQYARFLFLLL